MVDVLTDSQLDALTELYIAYFCRAPENDGLSFHTDAVLEQLNGTPPKTFEEALAERANQFYDDAVAQPEFTGYSTSLTAAEFVTKLYANVLAREAGGVGGPAPTDAEVAFWSVKIEGGELTRGEVVQRFLADQDILLTSGTPEEQALAADALALFENRVEVAREFALPENSAGLLGEEAVIAGKSALALVTPDPATVPLAIATFTGGPSGDTFILTDSIDLLTGTSKDDTFLAEADAHNALDNVDGGAGVDTAQFIAQGNGPDISGTFSNIEMFKIETTGPGGAADFDAAKTTGAEAIYLAGGNRNLDVVNIGNDVILGLATDRKLRAEFDADVLGKDATIRTAVDGADDEIEVRTDGDDTIIGLDVDVKSDSVLDIDFDDGNGSNSDLETITVHGMGDLELDDTGGEFNTVESINASGLTGGLSINMGANDEDFTFEGGSGNDDLQINQDGGTGGRVVNLNAGDDTVFFSGAGDFNADDALDGGDGIDTLRLNVNDAPGVDETNAVNFEVLALRGAMTADRNVDLNDTGIGTVELQNTFDLDGNDLIIDNYPGDMLNVVIDDDADLDGGGSELIVESTGGTDTVNFSFEGNGGQTLQRLDIENIETVNFSTDTTGDDVNVERVEGFGVEAITITGPGDFEFGTVSRELDDLASIDASGATGLLDIRLNSDIESIAISLGDFKTGSEIRLENDDHADTLTFGAFTADTDLELRNFTAGSGAEHDSLDLSAFGLAAADLTIDVSGADAIIEFDNADGDTMEITLVGQGGETAADIVTFNVVL
ncbi:MAG: DUF4214 domain-containing protein [Hyphomicrobiaceae bacterium]